MSLVKNAADQQQVRAAGQKERFRRKDELEDVQFLLSTLQGRRVLWRLLDYCGVFRSIYTQSSQIYYNSGQQDIGHFLMAEIAEADQAGFLKMMQEHYVKKDESEPKEQEGQDNG